jgi:UDP-GlcNAc3NAcA epimerase
MIKVAAVIGARPQFIKHFPVEIAAKNRLELYTIHTGQHYDYHLDRVFFDDFGLAEPRYNLQVGSHSHAVQTARMMIELESLFTVDRPDAVLLYGDTNSTLAGALAAAKLEIKIIHIEAGLRSNNKSMPEEINRVLTDRISDLLFPPTNTAFNNLISENIRSNVFLTGDVMCDAIHLVSKNAKINSYNTPVKDRYILATLHRPYNTDDPERLAAIFASLDGLPARVLLPMHPRTRNLTARYGIELDLYPNISFIDPQSYSGMVSMMSGSQAIITDSGGIQKEAYMLKKKCITLRSETEWIETLESGWNTLVFDDLRKIGQALDAPVGPYREGLYGDGKSADYIVGKIIEVLNE